MIYGSVCSGIEAASCAWHALGWRAAWFSEIEPFPCAVLAHRFPDVPNLGDMKVIAAAIQMGAAPAPDDSMAVPVMRWIGSRIAGVL